MMGRDAVRRPGAAGAARVLALMLAALFLLSAKAEKPEWVERLQKSFKKEKVKELKPVEDVFGEAEAYFNGRETWYGKLVKKTWGADSRAYQKLPGVKRTNFQQAKDLYQEVVDDYPFSKYAPVAELKIADCHYQLEEYEEAAVWYGQFGKMHPRRDEVPYALYQEGMCHFQQILKAPRDQDQTRQALASFLDLISRFPDDHYAAEAKGAVKDCNQRLAEHELLVAEFYFKHRDYWAAAARYQGVWRTYPGLGFDDQAMYMEGSSYAELGKSDLARAAYERDAAAFPDGEYGQKARERLKALK
ncbi:MAG TPA: outer membrane protein assembly factor BamD [bacterium]|nr:outer membrane protein assembly factor BamD [bacterium]